jgi:hypothetical protein
MIKGMFVDFFRDSYVLNDDQTKWVNSAREKIFQLIKETPPNGVQVKNDSD